MKIPLKRYFEAIFDTLTITKIKYHSIVLKIPPKEWSSGQKGEVLLIQGICGTWSGLRGIGNYLNKLGYRIMVVEKLGNNTVPVIDAVSTVKKHIKEYNLYNFIIIAHSKGGVIAVSLLADKEVNKRIKKIITISSPFSGSLWGHLRLFNSHELTPKSQLFNNLPINPPLNKKIVNICPCVDNLIIPNKNMYLKGGKNICIDVAGHFNIIHSEKTLQTIKQILEN